MAHGLTIHKAAGRWQSGSWFLRSERCYLIPGDSPVGYRLPLDSQPWVSQSDYPYLNPPDPAAPRAPPDSPRCSCAVPPAPSAVGTETKLPVPPRQRAPGRRAGSVH